MDTYEGNVEDFTPAQASAQDEHLLVKFFVKAAPDKAKTLENGCPIFVDREYVDIRVPGSRDGVSRPATPRDRARFPRHYAAFQQRKETPLEGTPLAEWPLATRSMVEMLAFSNVKTVEQLASMPDSASGNFMGAGNLKRQAQEWLEDAKDDAGTVRLTARLEEAEAQVRARDAAIEDLSGRLRALEASLQSPLVAEKPVPTMDSALDDLHSALDVSLAESDPAESPEASPPPPSPARAARRRRRGVKE